MLEAIVSLPGRGADVGNAVRIFEDFTDFFKGLR